MLDAALKGTEASNFEFPLYTKGGDRVQVLLNATTRRDAMGGITGVVGVGQDITELDQARSDLEAERVLLAARVDARTLELRKANFELERAIRLKDEFLASMSHELRTPMNTVLGMSEALAEGAYGSLNEDQRLNLELIHESGTHLLSLINDILDLSKIEGGATRVRQKQRQDHRPLRELNSHRATGRSVKRSGVLLSMHRSTWIRLR